MSRLARFKSIEENQGLGYTGLEEVEICKWSSLAIWTWAQPELPGKKDHLRGMSRQKGVQTKACPDKKGWFAKTSGQNTLNCAHLPNWFAPFIRTISNFGLHLFSSLFERLSLCSIGEICSIRSVLVHIEWAIKWIGQQQGQKKEEFSNPTRFAFCSSKNVKSKVLSKIKPDCSGFYKSKK